MLIRLPNESSALRGDVNKYEGIGHRTTLTGVCNSDCKKFIQDIADDFDRMVAGLVTNRIPIKQSAASQSSGPSDLGRFFLEVRQCAVSHKLI
jgi:hypothetical protein